jgi:ketosteroid isomerase-like protein
MSQENIEVVRAGAWNSGDMGAFGELLAIDVILRLPEGWPEPGPYVGREAAMRQFRQNREAFKTDRLEPISDYIRVGDRVLVRLIWRGEGQGPESAASVGRALATVPSLHLDPSTSPSAQTRPTESGLHFG